MAAEYPITVPFGFVDGYPVNGGWHMGVDFGTPVGVAVVAPHAGEVVVVGTRRPTNYPGVADGAWGVAVTIQVSDTVFVDLCHLSVILVRRGDFVAAGQTVGLSGDTGLVFGAHLHCQVRQVQPDGSDLRVDPASVGMIL